MIHHYRGMIDDPVRVAAFQRGIAAAVRPGDVVVDLGCGMGNFSVLACRAGAARVYAVEAGAIVEVAREVVRANGCADRVRFLAGRSTELEVPERARVVIFDDYVSTLLYPAVAATLSDVARRWLAPRGRLVPGQARLCVAPVEDRLGRDEIDRFRWGGERVSGVDLTTTRDKALSCPYSRRLAGTTPLSRPLVTPRMNLLKVGEAQVRASGTVRAERDGVMHGLVLWFELLLGRAWLSTGPSSPPTAWYPTVFPIRDPIAVETGDEIALSLEGGAFGREMAWRWRVAAGGRECEMNSLEGMPLEPEHLVRWEPDRVAELTPALEVDRFILDAVDGGSTLADIAARVRERFASRFPRIEDAQQRVVAVLQSASRAGPSRGE